MDRLRAMAAFVAVTEAGSLSAAARALGEPLTNLSRMISQLEAHLGCTLLHRSTRQMVLTPAGSEYLDTCRSVLDTVAMAERRIAGQADELSGDLALTAPVLFGRMYVVPVLAQFLAEYPRINARLLLIDRVVDLLDEGIDIALRIGGLRASRDPRGLVAPRHLRGPGLLGALRRSVGALGSYPARLRNVCQSSWWHALDLQKPPQWPQSRACAFPLVRQYCRRSRRSGDRGYRHHARSLVSGRGRVARGAFAAHPGPFRGHRNPSAARL